MAPPGQRDPVHAVPLGVFFLPAAVRPARRPPMKSEEGEPELVLDRGACTRAPSARRIEDGDGKGGGRRPPVQRARQLGQDLERLPGNQELGQVHKVGVVLTIAHLDRVVSPLHRHPLLGLEADPREGDQAVV